ncbi:MAG: hypothetical protein Q9169_004559 [Polycauliona sp. 2 TL-2023]
MKLSKSTRQPLTTKNRRAESNLDDEDNESEEPCPAPPPGKCARTIEGEIDAAPYEPVEMLSRSQRIKGPRVPDTPTNGRVKRPNTLHTVRSESQNNRLYQQTCFKADKSLLKVRYGECNAFREAVADFRDDAESFEDAEAESDQHQYRLPTNVKPYGRANAYDAWEHRLPALLMQYVRDELVTSAGIAETDIFQLPHSPGVASEKQAECQGKIIVKMIYSKKARAKMNRTTVCKKPKPTCRSLRTYNSSMFAVTMRCLTTRLAAAAEKSSQPYGQRHHVWSYDTRHNRPSGRWASETASSRRSAAATELGPGTNVAPPSPCANPSESRDKQRLSLAQVAAGYGGKIIGSTTNKNDELCVRNLKAT